MSIKFLLDENIPYALIDLLQEKGFDVKHLKKMGKQGVKNGEVYEIAENEKSWIVTRDADFQNFRYTSCLGLVGPRQVIDFIGQVWKTDADFALGTPILTLNPNPHSQVTKRMGDGFTLEKITKKNDA